MVRTKHYTYKRGIISLTHEWIRYVRECPSHISFIILYTYIVKLIFGELIHFMRYGLTKVTLQHSSNISDPYRI